MATIQEMQEKYFKPAGLEAIKTKMKSLTRLYNNSETKYPIENLKFYGFVGTAVFSREELFGRIRELAEMAGENLVINEQVVKIAGNEIPWKTIEVSK